MKNLRKQNIFPKAIGQFLKDEIFWKKITLKNEKVGVQQSSKFQKCKRLKHTTFLQKKEVTDFEKLIQI